LFQCCLETVSLRTVFAGRTPVPVSGSAPASPGTASPGTEPSALGSAAPGLGEAAGAQSSSALLPHGARRLEPLEPRARQFPCAVRLPAFRPAQPVHRRLA